MRSVERGLELDFGSFIFMFQKYLASCFSTSLAKTKQTILPPKRENSWLAWLRSTERRLLRPGPAEREESPDLLNRSAG